MLGGWGGERERRRGEDFSYLYDAFVHHADEDVDDDEAWMKTSNAESKQTKVHIPTYEERKKDFGEYPFIADIFTVCAVKIAILLATFHW